MRALASLLIMLDLGGGAAAAPTDAAPVVLTPLSAVDLTSWVDQMSFEIDWQSAEEEVLLADVEAATELSKTTSAMIQLEGPLVIPALHEHGLLPIDGSD